MSQSITASMTLRCIQDADGRSGARVPAQFTYHSVDPFVVKVLFVAEDVEWEFARDLLDGIEHPTGVGDVRIRPVDSASVSMHFSSDEGEATFHAPRRDLAEFARRTYRAVPRGRERMDLDAAVLKLLGSAR